jgi:hypothetical protein
LENTRKKILLHQFREFEDAVWCKWRRLYDDRISSQESCGELPHGEDEGEVPGTNSACNTKRNISKSKLDIIIILNNFFVWQWSLRCFALTSLGLRRSTESTHYENPKYQ